MDLAVFFYRENEVFALVTLVYFGSGHSAVQGQLPETRSGDSRIEALTCKAG